MVVLHTSLNVLWGTWEIPALPPQKEVFDVAGSVEEAHRATLKQKTLPALVTPACKQSWMWAKINQGATGICIYSSSAKIMVPGFIEKDLNTASVHKEVDTSKAEVRCERQRWGKSDRLCSARVHWKKTHLSYERLKGLKIQRAQ